MGYEWVTSELQVGYKWVTSGLKVGYEWGTSGLRAGYECVYFYFVCIVASICKHREIQCLLYAGFFF